jgi:hypothetical protein
MKRGIGASREIFAALRLRRIALPPPVDQIDLHRRHRFRIRPVGKTTLTA